LLISLTAFIIIFFQMRAKKMYEIDVGYILGDKSFFSFYLFLFLLFHYWKRTGHWTLERWNSTMYWIPVPMGLSWISIWPIMYLWLLQKHFSVKVQSL